LASAGWSVTGAPEQIKTWNLSSIWRIPTARGNAWLKVVPPFFAHEGTIMGELDPASVPRPIAADRGRMLIPEVEGVDQFDATGPPLVQMVDQLIALQASYLGRTADLLALGLPDRRLSAIGARGAAVVDDQAAALTSDERRRLDRLVQTLDRRAADLTSCGVPDTLVHGDFHPGNVRGGSDRHTILDWSDSAVGHPLSDELAFFRPLAAADRDLVRTAWSASWRRIVPGCDPERAVELLQPVMPLMAAIVYADFCAAIEPDERIYHARDVPAALRDAAALADKDVPDPVD
jgi:hypothetical protein